MRIDLHCHTIKTKQGDAETRNVTAEKFVEILSKHEVQIAAITNHNKFDISQYETFKSLSSEKDIDVWPGIELDVIVNGEEGHMIIICNPNDYSEFSVKIKSLINEVEPDEFSIDFNDLIGKIKELDIMLIAHHSLKDHGFSDKAIEQIKQIIKDEKPLMFEPSSLKTVGIMYANGINGFIGSDVSDWNNYPVSKIPTLKMNIKNYETFKLLIQKDPNTIDTFINQKEKNEVALQPFSDENDLEEIILTIYNDVNIIFGGKGTGKSKIIESLNKYYKEKFGNVNVEYYPAQTKESDFKNLIKRPIKKEYFNKFNISDCKNEFKKIKEWQDVTLTSLKSFLKGHQTKKASTSFNNFGFRTAVFSDMISSSLYDLSQQEYINIKKAISNLLEQKINEYITEEEMQTLTGLLTKIQSEAYKKMKDEWIKYKSLELEKFTIVSMQNIAKTKTGNSSIPSSVGFSDFCSNLFETYSCSKKIYDSFNLEKIQIKEYLGYIVEKGSIYLTIDLHLNPNLEAGVEYQKDKPGVTLLKQLYQDIENIFNKTFKEDINQYVRSFNDLCGDMCSSLRDCFGIKTYTSKDNNGIIEPYNPSSGEKCMLLLHNVLVNDNKNVYILDEPELSVGHKYINEIIVPRLKELAALDKIIIVSTHDANIAVRTLPLMTIYREYKKTYVGNLFINELVEINNANKIRWTDTSMTYLEGGDFAFKERGKSYGI